VRAFPPPHHMVQSEVIAYLRRQVFEDALAFGWIKPCVRKVGRGKNTIFFRWSEVEMASLRIASGEYPGGAKGKA
jgi:hypothetical protein